MILQEAFSKNLPTILGLGGVALIGYWASATADEAIKSHDTKPSAHFELQQDLVNLKSDVRIVQTQLDELKADQREAKDERRTILEKLDDVISKL